MLCLKLLVAFDSNGTTVKLLHEGSVYSCERILSAFLGARRHSVEIATCKSLLPGPVETYDVMRGRHSADGEATDAALLKSEIGILLFGNVQNSMCSAKEV